MSAGNPPCAYAVLFDPGRASAPGHLRRVRVAPATLKTKAPTI